MIVAQTRHSFFVSEVARRGGIMSQMQNVTYVFPRHTNLIFVIKDLIMNFEMDRKT